MIEMKENIEKQASKFENQQIYRQLIDQKLESFKKNYTISSINLFDGLIKLMSLCLIADHFITVFKPDSKEIKYLNELRKTKDNLLNKIKQEQSFLTIQGKLRQFSKFEYLKIMVIKIAYHILIRNSQKESTTQEQLFKRLNFLICGVNVSSKCYKLTLNKVNIIHKNVQILKQKQEKEQVKRSSKQNSQFKKIFGSVEANENKNQLAKKNDSSNDGNTKIQNMIKKVKNTINMEMKRLNSMHSNKQNEEKKQNESTEIEEKEEIVNYRRMSVATENKKNSVRTKKRVGTLNEKQNIDSRFKKFKDYIGSQSSNKSDHSYQSLAQTNQNWFKPQEMIMKVKKVYTLSLPGLKQK